MKLHRRNYQFIVLIFVVFCPIVFAPSAQFTNDQQLFFTGTSSNPSTVYQDAVGGNLDVGIQLCDVGSQHVGGFYAIQVNSVWDYQLVTYETFSGALAETTVNAGGGCFETLAGFLTVSPSQLTTPDPDVQKAALPGKLWIGYEAAENPGTISNFVFGDSNAQLLGDYTVTRSFTEATRQIAVSTPTISFQTSSGSFSKSATDASFGIASDRPMAIGVCDDQNGEFCSGGSVLTSATFPQSLSSGLNAGQVNDQNIYTKYVVLNGLGKDICIGANLQADVTSVSPDPIYYSQTLTIDVEITNPRDTPFETDGGNVAITSAFDVTVDIYNASNPTQIVYTTTFNVASGIAVDGTVNQQLQWPAYRKSGTYTVRITADVSNDITECNEVDNTGTQDFDLLPITLPDIYIDGVATTNFSTPNIPYNLSFHLQNSDNDTLSNANFTIVEKNGLSVTFPTQVFNRLNGSNSSELSGTMSESKMTIISDYLGNGSLILIPNYNQFYNAEFAGYQVGSALGGYQLYFEGYQEDNQEFIFIISGQVSSTFPLNITNTAYQGPYSLKPRLQSNLVPQLMDFIYNTYTNFLEHIVG